MVSIRTSTLACTSIAAAEPSAGSHPRRASGRILRPNNVACAPPRYASQKKQYAQRALRRSTEIVPR